MVDWKSRLPSQLLELYSFEDERSDDENMSGVFDDERSVSDDGAGGVIVATTGTEHSNVDNDNDTEEIDTVNDTDLLHVFQTNAPDLVRSLYGVGLFHVTVPYMGVGKLYITCCYYLFIYFVRH